MPFQDSLLAPRPAWTLDSLRLLAQHRFLTARQLAAALDLERAVVAPALDDLVREGVLQTLTATTLSLQTTLGPAYVLTRAGAACLAGELVDVRALVRPYRSAFTLGHELMVRELALVLEALDRRGHLRLIAFETARERIADVAHLAVKGRPERIALVADALVVVEHRGVKTGFLVELDMGTVSSKRMREKFAGYHAWWADGGPTRRFGLTATRVLTIAPAPRRLHRLRALAVQAVDGRGSGLFWFVPMSVLDAEVPERLLEAVATIGRAGDDEPRPLLDL